MKHNVRPLYRAGEAKNAGMKRAIKGMALVTFVGAILTASLYACMYNTGYQDVVELSEVELIQIDAPQAGAPTAVVHTTMGDISFELFPEQAPNAVENFQTLARDGFYDNTYVYRVEDGAFFAAGAKEKTGELGDAIDEPREKIKQELSEDLWPLRGALCAVKTRVEGGFFDRFVGKTETYNGSRFVVPNSIEFTPAVLDEMFEDNEDNIVAKAFAEHGGIPNFSRQLTVFGQAYAGLDVLDAITEVALVGEEENHRPAEDILITGVTLGTYSAENSTVSTEFSTNPAQTDVENPQ